MFVIPEIKLEDIYYSYRAFLYEAEEVVDNILVGSYPPWPGPRSEDPQGYPSKIKAVIDALFWESQLIDLPQMFVINSGAFADLMYVFEEGCFYVHLTRAAPPMTTGSAIQHLADFVRPPNKDNIRSIEIFGDGSGSIKSLDNEKLINFWGRPSTVHRIRHEEVEQALKDLDKEDS